MFIQTENTPNPATVKFLPGRTVMDEGSANFTNAETADSSPLARDLFAIDGVTAVFYGIEFVSVTKADEADWQALKPQILGAIMGFFDSGEPLFGKNRQAAAEVQHGNTDDPADAEVIDTIKQLLDDKIRPAVAQDGGDIVYHGYQQGVVYLDMIGACAGCPMSTATLKNGIENLLKYYIPEVTEVRATQGG